MLDWIIIAIGGGLLAAGCATGSIVTKLFQRLLFTHKNKKEAVKEAVNAQDIEAGREGQGDGMEDLLFDEKLRLLVMKENLKKKLLNQKLIIQQLMGGIAGGEKGQQGTAVVKAQGDQSCSKGDGSDAGINNPCEVKKSDRQTRQEAEVEYFASELELSKWNN